MNTHLKRIWVSWHLQHHEYTIRVPKGDAPTRSVSSFEILERRPRIGLRNCHTFIDQGVEKRVLRDERRQVYALIDGLDVGPDALDPTSMRQLNFNPWVMPDTFYDLKTKTPIDRMAAVHGQRIMVDGKPRDQTRYTPSPGQQFLPVKNPATVLSRATLYESRRDGLLNLLDPWGQQEARLELLPDRIVSVLAPPARATMVRVRDRREVKPGSWVYTAEFV